MLAFVEKGQGPVLLFVHAFPLDHSMWDAQIRHFEGRYRVIAPDLPGFGGTPDRAWSIAEAGEQLRELLHKLGVRTCALAGLSMGGYIAIPFAANYPETVSKLVLAHTRARADTDLEKAMRNGMIASLRRDGTASLPEKLLPRLLGPQVAPDVREGVRKRIEAANAEAAAHAVEAMRDRQDSTPLLARIQCPVLVIAGDSDAIIKPEDSRDMAAALPHGTLTVIPNTGHLSNLEDPSSFNSALDGFL
jgi:pimeloyl-ACP methyl ester carboxylesterase